MTSDDVKLSGNTLPAIIINCVDTCFSLSIVSKVGWGHLPSEAKASKPCKTSLRIEFSRPENPKIHEKFLIRTISGDDVIFTDKTSETSAAVQ